MLPTSNMEHCYLEACFYRLKHIHAKRFCRTLEMHKHFSKHCTPEQQLSRIYSISQKVIKSGCWPLPELIISKDSEGSYLVMIPCCFLSVDFSVVFTFLSWSGIVKHQSPELTSHSFQSKLEGKTLVGLCAPTYSQLMQAKFTYNIYLNMHKLTFICNIAI